MSLDANNYSKLVTRGRAKSIGVPWTEKEWADIQAVQGAERETLIAKFRGVVPTVETPKVEEPKVETPEVPAEEPAVAPKKVRKVKK